MEILFKREQMPGLFGRIRFKLWAMLEVDEDELALIRRYDIDRSVLIVGDDEGLLRRGFFAGLVIALLVFALLSTMAMNMVYFELITRLALSLLAGIAAGYWWMNEKRETIFMRDLLHGRSFKCASVIDLAKKEAWLENATATFRQVLESAKHWDGVEHREVPVLPPEEAKALIVQAFP